MDKNETGVATLGGGCFWCLEAVFERLSGVEHVESGYSGGNVPSPSYEQVCTGNTGHAEVVQITFSSRVISFSELLQVFFAIHDPTTLNRQGPDIGTPYRSVVFFESVLQKADAERAIADLDRAGTWGQPLVTEVAPLTRFYPAEEYHQQYYQRNPDQGYCRLVIDPKVAKFRKDFRRKLKPETTTTRT